METTSFERKASVECVLRLIQCWNDYPIDTWEQQLRSVLQKAGGTTTLCWSSTTTTNHGRPGRLCGDATLWQTAIEALFSDQTLCEHHNRLVVESKKAVTVGTKDTVSATSAHLRSPLCFVLECLADPTLCPTVGLPVVCKAVWRLLNRMGAVGQNDGASNCNTAPPENLHGSRVPDWNPSQRLLVAFLTKHLVLTPSPAFQSGPFLDEHWSIDTMVNDLDTAVTMQRLLRHWIVSCHTELSHRGRLLWRTKLLELMGALDQLEQSELIRSRSLAKYTVGSGASHGRDTAAGATTRPPALGALRKRQRTSSTGATTTGAAWKYWHGELCDEQEESFLAAVRAKRRYPESLPLISQSAVLRYSLTLDEYNDTVRAKLLSYWKLKAHCLHLFVQSSRQLIRDGQLLGHHRPPIVATILLPLVLNVVAKHAASAILRLCVLWLVSQCGERVGVVASTSAPIDHESAPFLYAQLVALTWSKVERSLTRDESAIFLRLYGECIAECAYFDTLDHLHTALCPLMDKIGRIVHKQQAGGPSIDSDRPGQSDHSLARDFLQCFAFLLSCRGSMMLSLAQNESPELASLFSQLALKLDRTSDWFAPNMPPTEYKALQSGLQMAGILGLDEEKQSTGQERGAMILNGVADDTREAPFPLFNSQHYVRMGAVIEQLEPWLPRHFDTITLSKQLSRHSCANETPPKAEVSVVASACLAEYLNNDLLDKVFSFLNYKRLTRMRRVCTNWKKLADSDRLWQYLYNARFRRHGPNDDGSVINRDWKRLFAERWQAERDIRFRVCSVDPSWKVQLCPRVGCLAVLNTPSVAQRHCRAHLPGSRTKRRKRSTSTSSNYWVKDTIEQL
jgi:F-box domain